MRAVRCHVYECLAHVLLERLDLPTDGWLTQAQTPRGFGQTPAFQNDAQYVQALPIEVLQFCLGIQDNVY